MKTITVLAVVSALLLLLIPSSAAADTADDVKCTGCVGSPDILDFGVKTKDLGIGAVTSPKINDGAVNWKKLASDLQQRIEQLEATVAALEDALATNTALQLDGYLYLDTTDPASPVARFAGVNVQVINGLGMTESVNGLGNLIVGYDEPYQGSGKICSDGTWDAQADCEADGEVWATNHKSGSHNLVIGPRHRYSQAGGLIAGAYNSVNRTHASVTGGRAGIASGVGASVSGGRGNAAFGEYSVVSGGDANVADGKHSVISGGVINTTWGNGSVVSGGYANLAKQYAVVSGGQWNTADGPYSVVTGGFSNRADGEYSAVSGGYDREAAGNYDWVAGELWQDR